MAKAQTALQDVSDDLNYDSLIQEVFGQFGTKINEKVELFVTFDEAKMALIAWEKDSEFVNEGNSFGLSQGFEVNSKGYKGKSNVIVAYLTWVAADRPEYVKPADIEAAAPEQKTEGSEEGTKEEF